MRLNSAAAGFLRARRLNFYALVWIAVIVLGAFVLAKPVSVWFQQAQDIAAVQTQLDQAKSDLGKMKVERKRWDDPVYIRSQARDRLYYVLPGEVSYLVTDASSVDTSDLSGTVGAALAKQRNSSQISADIMRVKKNWVDSLLLSVVHAGIDEPKS